MPATTVNHLLPMLINYIEPDGEFKNSLNQVLSRIYNMGTYRDLTIQYSLPVVDNCITLPDEADSVLHTIVDNQPVPVRSLWHDFKSVGMGVGAADLTWGLVDAGFHPLKRLIETATDVLHVVPSDQSPTRSNFDSDDNESVVVTATNGDKIYASTTNSVASSDVTLTFAEDINSVISIQFDGLTDLYDIRTNAADPDTTIATIGPDSGVTRYRRFRLNRSTNGQTNVHVLCKRAFQPVRNGTDIVYVSNVGALKHGMLGRLMEDNADIERSEYHWNKCVQLMEEEAATSRGAAIPRLNVDPYGTGNLNRIYQLY
jgi:hypothetical protein